MRYKITTSNGRILKNTMTLPESSFLVMVGGYYTKKPAVYSFSYDGENSDCGQNGYVHAKVSGSKIRLSFSKYGENDPSCSDPNVPYTELMPINPVEFTKQ